MEGLSLFYGANTETMELASFIRNAADGTYLYALLKMSLQSNNAQILFSD